MLPMTLNATDSLARSSHESTAARASMAFVTCVEAGGLEEQAVRLIKSFRIWGGQFADAPFFAVNPRFGMPLARATRRALDDLGVIFRKIRPVDAHSWYAFNNKPHCVIDAEEQTDADVVCWLDADMLVLGEPTELMPAEDEDFVACAPDKNIGTSADDDAAAPYWREACRILGLDLQAIPWTLAHRDRVQVRLYFNSGVFACRRAAGFGQAYLDGCHQMIDAKIASRESGIFFNEQVSLGLAAIKAGLRWRALPHVYNYAIGSKIERLIDPAKLRETKILHYHDAMWPAFWPRLLEHLKATRPDVHDWLAPQGPIRGQMSPLRKIPQKLINRIRLRRRAKHQAECRAF